jgi:hypothetical protein
MLRLLIDHDLDQDILRGLIHRVPDLDAVAALEVGLSAASDPELLAWAAAEGRVIVTHDYRTMPDHAGNRMAAGETIAGLIVVSRRLSIREVLNDLEMIVSCSDANEWENIVRHLPL